MKKTRTVFIALGCILFTLPNANSGLLGDVDLDGTIGLTEAVNALQVTSGVRSPLSASYVIVWKGTWTAGQNYQVYDAVHLDGSSYICLQSHTSDLSQKPPYAPVWEPLALKGDPGQPQTPRFEVGMATFSGLADFGDLGNSGTSTRAPVTGIGFAFTNDLIDYPQGKVLPSVQKYDVYLELVNEAAAAVLLAQTAFLGNPIGEVFIKRDVDLDQHNHVYEDFLILKDVIIKRIDRVANRGDSLGQLVLQISFADFVFEEPSTNTCSQLIYSTNPLEGGDEKSLLGGISIDLLAHIGGNQFGGMTILSPLGSEHGCLLNSMFSGQSLDAVTIKFFEPQCESKPAMILTLQNAYVTMFQVGSYEGAKVAIAVSFQPLQIIWEQATLNSMCETVSEGAFSWNFVTDSSE